MKTVRDFDVAGKKVLMRVDFNVPLDKEGHITDDTRIRLTLPTIAYLLEKGARVILMSHLGRPEKKNDPKCTLQPCAHRLAQLLKKPVRLSADCIGAEVEKEAASLQDGEVLLLENLRFHKAEEKPELDPSFAQSLAKLGDIYINDAFGSAHRKHSSTYTIPSFFPGAKGAGFLMEKEVKTLTALLTEPKRPFYAVIGGAKIGSKIGVLQALLDRVDALFIGGGMAYTFMKASGIEIGDSICEEDGIPTAKKIVAAAEKKGIPLYFPLDFIIADAFAADAKSRCVLAEEGIPSGWQGMDIGPKTLEQWKEELSGAGTIFWNGPVGVFEFPRFAEGTSTLAKCISETKALTVVGGGDSVAAIENLGISKNFTHISTGGGASLEFIEFGGLPGVDALVK